MPADPVPDLIIRRRFPRPAVPEAMRGVPIGFVVDAQGRFGGLDHRIKPVTSLAAFCGPALTVLCREGDNLAAHVALNYIEPGDVVVIAAGGFERVAVIGEKWAGMAKNKGAVAIVVDGMARDSAGLAQVGIPIFARGVTPNSSFKHGPGQIGVPVSVGGIAISSADMICGDPDGVVAVPAYQLDAVAARLAEITRSEAAMFAAIQTGGPKPPEMAKIGTDSRITLID
ncbi:MAG: RraA family protein [Acetobacteraceae bacterium]